MNAGNDSTFSNNALSTKYTLRYSDGNSGVEETFNTFKEAEDAGDRIWYRLSKDDQKKYSSKVGGTHFDIVVYADEGGESWFTVKDYTMEVELMGYTITVVACDKDPIVDGYAYKEDYEYDLACYLENDKAYKVHVWNNHAIVVVLTRGE